MRELESSLAAAQRALKANDPDLALAIWKNIRREHPSDPNSYILAVSCLGRANRAAEAEQLMAQAPLSLIGDLSFIREWALVAHHAADFETAIRRWQILQVVFPDSDVGYIGLSASLRDSHKTQAAQEILQIAIDQFPSSSGLLIEHAKLAAMQNDWPEAIKRWGSVRNRFPEEVVGYTGGAETLLGSGDLDGANELLQTGIGKFAENSELLILHARVAERQANWRLAASRWASALIRDPYNGWLLHRLEASRLGIGQGSDTAEMFKIMMSFESLGSARLGVEFGLVQRMFGAEPLSLLRWSDISIGDLTEALIAEFEGVGIPENTEVQTESGRHNSDYVTKDKRFGLVTQSFIKTGDVPLPEFLESACRSIQFLRRKFLSDLSNAGRIYVFKVDEIGVGEAQMRRLHLALSQYGDNFLLCVRLADSSHPDGMVDRLSPRLMVAYISRFMEAFVGEDKADLPSSWAQICRIAAMMSGIQ